MREFNILVFGKGNVDFLIDSDRYDKDYGPEGVDLTLKNKLEPHPDPRNDQHYHIKTDLEPTTSRDKVTSLIALDDVVLRFENFMKWGGGGLNSVVALANTRTLEPMGLTFFNSTYPDLTINGQTYDLITYLKNKGVTPHSMNLIPLNYSIVLGGKNKVIVRNEKKVIGSPKLSREEKGTIEVYLRSADGVLINALDHLDMTSAIVNYIHQENEAFYAGDAQMREGKDAKAVANSPDKFDLPQHRKVYTVITDSKNMPFNELVKNVIPYTGIIVNYEDLLKLFYGIENASFEELGPDPAIKAMAQLRKGIPTKEGKIYRINDQTNNIYVTVGKNGHLVAVGDQAFHVKPSDSLVEEVGPYIKRNKASSSGAGDSFAAGVIKQETLGYGADVIGTAAKANETVYRFLGLNRVTHRGEFSAKEPFSLSKHYQDKILTIDDATKKI